MKWLKLAKKFLFPLFSFTIFVVFLVVLKQELQEYNWQDLIASLRGIPFTKQRIAIALTMLGYLVIAHYDKIAFAAAGYKLSSKKLLSTTFLSYAICNNLGFMLLIGGGIRYRFYRYYGVPPKVIAVAIAFSNLNFWLGLCSLGGLIFLFNPLVIPQFINSQFVTVRPIGLIFLSLILIYLFFSWQRKTFYFRQQKLTIPRLSISLAQILVSALDWAIASTVLYILLPQQDLLGYGSFFGVYLLAIAARTISNVPGGVGVFEGTIIAFLPSTVSELDSLSALLAYRVIYFLFPLVVALILFALLEIKRKINQ